MGPLTGAATGQSQEISMSEASQIIRQWCKGGGRDAQEWESQSRRWERVVVGNRCVQVPTGTSHLNVN